MNLLQQFPYVARRERRKPVDHGPDNSEFGKKFWKDFLMVIGLTLIGIVVMIICAFGGNGIDRE
jgi:hypothetical protein